MINLLSYSLNLISNFFLILIVPKIFIGQFLIFYSILGFLFSFIFIKIFSKKINILKIRKFFFLSLLLLLSIFSKNQYLLFILYPIVLIFSDYYFTQIKLDRFNLIFRVIMIVPLIFYFLGLDKDFLNLIIYRIIIPYLFIFFSFSLKYKFYPLAIRFPGSYILTSHILYYFPLFLLTLFLDGQSLKIWYLSYQIGFSVILKTIDIEIRKITNKINIIKNINYFLILSLPFYVNFFYKEIYTTIFYYTILICLIILKKKTI